MRRDNYHHHRRRFVPVADMNTHTIRPVGSHKLGVPVFIDSAGNARHFAGESIQQNKDRWEVRAIARSYPNGDTENQLELEV